MSQMESFLDDPDDVINDPLIIAVGPDANRDEANENMWCLGMAAARAATTSVADIRDFLYAVLTNRNLQLLRRFPPIRGSKPYGMVFYAWVDAQPGQLRFSLISGRGV